MTNASTAGSAKVVIVLMITEKGNVQKTFQTRNATKITTVKAVLNVFTTLQTEQHNAKISQRQNNLIWTLLKKCLKIRRSTAKSLKVKLTLKSKIMMQIAFLILSATPEKLALKTGQSFTVFASKI